jgi:hypothetical protein
MSSITQIGDGNRNIYTKSTNLEGNKNGLNSCTLRVAVGIDLEYQSRVFEGSHEA